MKDALNELFNKCAEGNIEYADDTEQLSEQEVNEIMKKFRTRLNEREKPVKSSAGLKRRFILGTAAAAAIAVLVPTSVYAYNRYKASIEKTADYQNTLMIEGSNTVGEQLMDFEMGWIPDGFTKVNDHCYDDGKENINIQFYKTPDNGTQIDMPWSADCKTYESDGKTAMINYRLSYNSGREYNHGREIWVIFDGTDYFLEISLPDNVSEEDALKIVDNAKLVPTDKVCYNTYFYWEDTDGLTDGEQEQHSIDIDKCDIYKVGDTIIYKENMKSNNKYSLTLDSAELTDSFDGINTDACGNAADYSVLTDENGNIAECTREYVRYGDGIDTINKVLEEKKIPVHILKLNAVYTNISDEALDIGVRPYIARIKDGEPIDQFFFYDNEKGVNYEDSINGVRIDDNRFFSFDTEPDKKEDKNSIHLEAGETAKIQAAFFVTDDQLDNLYTYFNMFGNDLSYAVENGDCPLFDLNN